MEDFILPYRRANTMNQRSHKPRYFGSMKNLNITTGNAAFWKCSGQYNFWKLYIIPGKSRCLPTAGS